MFMVEMGRKKKKMWLGPCDCAIMVIDLHTPQPPHPPSAHNDYKVLLESHLTTLFIKYWSKTAIQIKVVNLGLLCHLFVCTSDLVLFIYLPFFECGGG